MPRAIDTTAEVRPLSQVQVATMFHVSVDTLFAWVANGTFPQPVRLSERKFFWASDVIEKLLREGVPDGRSRKR
jgi:predicted DNA-binding transcriptional regulator AlpA